MVSVIAVLDVASVVFEVVPDMVGYVHASEALVDAELVSVIMEVVSLVPVAFEVVSSVVG